MIRNYFKTAIRNLLRNKVFSFINVVGLSLGIACSLLIFLWIKDERAMDTFNSKGNRLYQVLVSDKDKNGALTYSYDNTPGLLADALKRQIPEISRTSTFISEEGLLFTVGKKIGKEKGCDVGSNFFDMFSFPLLKGNRATALNSPDNIVISQKLADNYFGDQDPMGKIVRIGDKRDYIVSGVAANTPENSTIQFDFALPIQRGFEDHHWMIEGWEHYGPATYVLLRQDASIATVNAKLKDFLFRQDKQINDKSLFLQLFSERYLYSNFTNGHPDGGRIEYVYLFSIIAAFILLIACINYMNLATARSVKRAKEVGIRKVVGALRVLLFRQFLLEALITSLVSVILAIALVFLLIPSFNHLTEKQISFRLNDPALVLTLVMITLITGFIAGSYPAFFLSSLNPISVLKGVLKFKHSDSVFRKTLVVFQFTISIVLIVCTIVVFEQMKYVQMKDLGLDHSNLIYIHVEGDLINHYDNFKREALHSGNIESISFCGTEPTHVGWFDPSMTWKGKDPNDKTLFAQVEVGYDFLKTMKIPLIAGRDFSSANPSDSSNYIINETAARYMKLKNPIGAAFSNYSNKQGKIIGMVKDYHINSLQVPIVPLYMNLALAPEEGAAVIRTFPGKTKQALAILATLTRKFNPKYPFDYVFVDDELNKLYHSEMIIEQLGNAFAMIAIFISCMGLFGLSMFMAAQRTREIGIRKIVGASVSGIVVLLSRDFLALVVLAFVIASPIAWLGMNSWLQGFAYRINVSWWIFGLAGTLAVGIAALTISFQAIRAAEANPINSLRTE